MKKLFAVLAIIMTLQANSQSNPSRLMDSTFVSNGGTVTGYTVPGYHREWVAGSMIKARRPDGNQTLISTSDIPANWNSLINRPVDQSNKILYSALEFVPAKQTALVDSSNAIRSAKANVESPLFTGSIGYAVTSGGSVTQATSKSTAVTLNKICGRITMSNAALTAGSEVAFTVNNNLVAATDVIIVNVQSVGTANAYLVSVGAVSSNSFSITVSNASAGSLSQAVVLNFFVLKSTNQ